MAPISQCQQCVGLRYWNKRLNRRLAQWPVRHLQDLTTYMPSLQGLLKKLLLYSHDLELFVVQVRDSQYEQYMQELGQCLGRLSSQISQCMTALRCTYRRIHNRPDASWTTTGNLWPDSKRDICSGLFKDIYRVRYSDEMDGDHLYGLVTLIEDAAKTEKLLNILVQEGMDVREEIMSEGFTLDDTNYNNDWEADNELYTDDDKDSDNDSSSIIRGGSSHA